MAPTSKEKTGSSIKFASLARIPGADLLVRGVADDGDRVSRFAQSGEHVQDAGVELPEGKGLLRQPLLATLRSHSPRGSVQRRRRCHGSRSRSRGTPRASAGRAAHSTRGQSRLPRDPGGHRARAPAAGIRGGYQGFVEIKENGCVGCEGSRRPVRRTQPIAYKHLRSKKVLCRHFRLLQDGRNGALRQVSRVIGNGGSMSSNGVPPNLVAASSMAFKCKSQPSQLLGHLSIGESGEPTHQTPTGISNSTTSIFIVCKPSGRGSPCSLQDSISFLATS